MSRGEELNYMAQDVVCATGLGKPWMPDLCVAHPNVLHSHFVDTNNLPYGAKFCVVGSGLTAATLAVAMAESGARVDLCGRSQMSVMQLETDPGWRPGERLQKLFVNTDSSKERARQLKAARTANVVTPDVWERVTTHMDYGSIEVHAGVSVEGVEITSSNTIHINNKDVDAVIFATGYKVDARSMPMLSEVKDELNFEDGLPILNNDFESDVEGLYFMGKLGELAGGPLMRNIPGARYASTRIAEQIA
jgi:cation diffusion facilitator CzcD-associated flavoprotein CzcO